MCHNTLGNDLCTGTSIRIIPIILIIIRIRVIITFIFIVNISKCMIPRKYIRREQDMVSNQTPKK